MGNCESLASKAFTSDSKGLAGGALGAATTGAGSGGATLWQRAACKPENTHTRTRTKIRRVNDCLVERKTIHPVKSVNSNSHFNAILSSCLGAPVNVNSNPKVHGPGLRSFFRGINPDFRNSAFPNPRSIRFPQFRNPHFAIRNSRSIRRFSKRVTSERDPDA